jgi:hypothetical protein
MIDITDKEDIARGVYSPNFELKNLGRLMKEVLVIVLDLSLQK